MRMKEEYSPKPGMGMGNTLDGGAMSGKISSLNPCPVDIPNNNSVIDVFRSTSLCKKVLLLQGHIE
jgi:hypothetical protein